MKTITSRGLSCFKHLLIPTSNSFYTWIFKGQVLFVRVLFFSLKFTKCCLHEGNNCLGKWVLIPSFTFPLAPQEKFNSVDTQKTIPFTHLHIWSNENSIEILLIYKYFVLLCVSMGDSAGLLLAVLEGLCRLTPETPVGTMCTPPLPTFIFWSLRKYRLLGP